MRDRTGKRCAEHASLDPKEVAATFDEVVRKMRRDARSIARPKVSRLAQARNALASL